MSQVKVNKVSPRSGTDITLDGKLITESNGDLIQIQEQLF